MPPPPHGAEWLSEFVFVALLLCCTCPMSGVALHVHVCAAAPTRMLRVAARQPGLAEDVPLVVVTWSDGSLRCYNAEGDLAALRRRAHRTSVLVLDGGACNLNRIATGAEDGTVCLWDLEIVRTAPAGGATAGGVGGAGAAPVSASAAVAAALALVGRPHDDEGEEAPLEEPGLPWSFRPVCAMTGAHTRWISAVALSPYYCLTASLEGLRLWDFTGGWDHRVHTFGDQPWLGRGRDKDPGRALVRAGPGEAKQFIKSVHTGSKLAAWR